MTRLKVHAARRLSFRFRTRKSQSTPNTVTSESIEKSSSNQEKGCEIATDVKKHRSVITIQPKLETKATILPKVEKNAFEVMDEQKIFKRGESAEDKEESEDITQNVVNVLRRILEQQSLNSSQVYCISGQQLRIDVLEDTDL